MIIHLPLVVSSWPRYKRKKTNFLLSRIEVTNLLNKHVSRATKLRKTCVGSYASKMYFIVLVLLALLRSQIHEIYGIHDHLGPTLFSE